MIELAVAYIVAISTLLVCGVSALTLIYTVKHSNLPDVRSSADEARTEVAV